MSILNAIKRIAILAGPMTFIQLTVMVSSFLCMSMLAKLGAAELAASALIFAIQMSITVVGLSFLFSISILVSHAYGEKKFSDIGNYMQQGWVLAILISIPIMILFWHMGPLMSLLKQPPELIPFIDNFFKIYIWAVIPFLIAVCNQQLCFGVNKPILVVVIAPLSVAVLLIFAYILIFGKFGFPACGVKGLGYAMAIQMWFIAVVMMLVFYFQKGYKQFNLFNLSVHKNFQHIKRMFKIGGPISLQMGGELLSFAVTTALVGLLGVVSLAANQVVTQYLFIVVVPIFALSQTAGILISHAFGAKQLHEIKILVHTILGITFIITLFVAIVFILYPRSLATMYINIDDPANAATLHLVISLFSIIAISQIFDAIRNVLTGALRGLFDAKFPMYVGLIAIWLIGLPLAYVLGFIFHLGVVGMAVGNMIGVFFGAAIIIVRWITLSKNIHNIQLT